MASENWKTLDTSLNGTIDSFTYYESPSAYQDENGHFIWNKCPGCGGQLMTWLENGQRKQRCMDGKTTGCLWGF